MATATRASATRFEVPAVMAGLSGDGVIGLKGAFGRRRVADLRAAVAALFAEALARPGGAAGRGPKRHYVEAHPERLRGFAGPAAHPWVAAVCEAVLGPGYKIVEVGFDVPRPGARAQPWHRDLPAPGRRSPAGGSTPWRSTGRAWTWSPRWARSGSPRAPSGTTRPGSGTACARRSTCTRGTRPGPSGRCRRRGTSPPGRPGPSTGGRRTARARPGRSWSRGRTPRTPGTPTGTTSSSPATPTPPCPTGLKRHLAGRTVDRLEPIVQAHTIEGLMMGEA